MDDVVTRNPMLLKAIDLDIKVVEMMVRVPWGAEADWEPRKNLPVTVGNSGTNKSGFGLAFLYLVG